jgi:hypothetical protein
MDLAADLESAGPGILQTAESALARARADHYRQAGPPFIAMKLGELYGVLIECTRQPSTLAMTQKVDVIARERFEAGFSLAEVQTAINVLEEAVWSHIVASESSADLARDLALVSTILGAAKDALGQTYVALAAQRHTPTIDLQALVDGAATGAGNEA